MNTITLTWVSKARKGFEKVRRKYVVAGTSVVFDILLVVDD